MYVNGGDITFTFASVYYRVISPGSHIQTKKATVLKLGKLIMGDK